MGILYNWNTLSNFLSLDAKYPKGLRVNYTEVQFNRLMLTFQ